MNDIMQRNVVRKYVREKSFHNDPARAYIYANYLDEKITAQISFDTHPNRCY